VPVRFRADADAVAGHGVESGEKGKRLVDRERWWSIHKTVTELPLERARGRPILAALEPGSRDCAHAIFSGKKIWVGNARMTSSGGSRGKMTRARRISVND